MAGRKSGSPVVPVNQKKQPKPKSSKGRNGGLRGKSKAC